MDIVAKFLIYLIWFSTCAYTLGRVQTKVALFLAAVFLAATVFVLPKFTITIVGGVDASPQKALYEEGRKAAD